MPTLHWLTRDKDIRAASDVPYRLLEEAPELSAGESDAGNMLIQGDNLEALKALLPFYAGQVKCIYIDPPYNTRSAFEHYDDNLEHTQWLALMWPRLELLRELLAEDGSIWITIDDNEAHYLKVVMDEVFGRKNFISNVIWQKNSLRKMTLSGLVIAMITSSVLQKIRLLGDPTSYHVLNGWIIAIRTLMMIQGGLGFQLTLLVQSIVTGIIGLSKLHPEGCSIQQRDEVGIVQPRTLKS